MANEIIRQHLIDPELCIRCNTCEESCPIGAISNDFRNYVVDADICNACQACINPCPTGAINVWRQVPQDQVYTREEQFQWDALPEELLISPNQCPTESRGGYLRAPGRASGGPAKAFESLFTSKHPAEGLIRDNTRLTSRETEVEIHHIVLDLSAQDFPFLEGQSVGIIPPGRDNKGKPHLMRLYSVASQRDGEDGMASQLALTVKRVVKDNEGKLQRGKCSNFLCDLPVGSQIQVVGPFGVGFLMPSDEQAPLIMICTGTGIAPMRAMIQRRQALTQTAADRMLLFYGGRTPHETAYYDELAVLKGQVLDLSFAFSRQSGQPRHYVQDVLRDRHETVARLLGGGKSHLYLCGLKGMEQGVFESLFYVCAQHGLDWNAVMAQMSLQSRLHVETY
jgi:benzoyl-CoA 2,3-dioxygenase component A